MAVVLLWTGCENEEINEPKQGVTFPVSICLPANETNMMTYDGGPRRVMGDPGATELFVLPKYIYIFITYKDGGGDWKVWDRITIDDADESWEKQYYTGAMMGSGDSIYRYTKNIVKPLLAGEKFEGRVYAIASAVALTFDATLTNGTSTETDLLNLRFSTAGEIQRKLQHIYSTPYNYEVEDKYYGSFNSIEHNVPRVNIMLYHVAAKVDITWNVADSARVKKADVTPIRLTRMDACNLFNGNAYCFKPMANNELASPLEPAAGTGDTIDIVSAGDEGLWWEGRSYFYTIPYTTTGKAGYFPLQMRMETNGSGAYYRPTIYLKVATDGVFVPWLRATFNIKNPLSAGTDEKIVNN